MSSYLFVIEGVLVPIVSTLGLLGNILSVIIFYKSHGDSSLHSNFTKLLVCLGIFDSLFLIVASSIYLVRGWSLWSSDFILAIPFVIPLAGIFLTCSVYTVVAITVERYATIRQIHSRIFSARVLVFFVIFISVSYNFIKFFDHTVEIVNDLDIEGNVTSFIQIKPTWLRIHPTYTFVYSLIINILVMTLIPTVILTVLNILILRSIRKMTQNQSDTAMVTTLFSIVIISLVCHTPRVILNVNEGIGNQYSKWFECMASFSHLSLSLNSSINIIIYIARDLKFRQALVQIFKVKRKSMMTADIYLKSMDSEHTKQDIISEA